MTGVRGATPGDLFRTIGAQFGLSDGSSPARSIARFKPMALRSDEDRAAAAYARAVEKKTGRD